MQTKQGYTLESLRNVKAFLELNADKLNDVIATGAKAELLQTITDLEAYGNQQTQGAAAAKNATRVARALRHALIHDHMAVVSRIGRTKLPNTPEFANLKMPRGNPSTARLIDAAYEMANSAQKNASVFVAAGLPEDFATRLKSAADAVIDARQQRSLSRADRHVATQALKDKLSAARKLVNVLDAMVKTAVRSDPTLLPGWNQVKRVSRITAFGPASAPTASPAPTTPAAPARAA
jgi:hypothetical protein